MRVRAATPLSGLLRAHGWRIMFELAKPVGLQAPARLAALDIWNVGNNANLLSYRPGMNALRFDSFDQYMHGAVRTYLSLLM